ncbi:MAG: TlpA family protein disulfide reductase [Epsilonproteobacteria bacterium]|nr:TlpA family protein disulfide reductase [Campylobacterota bacterium]
MLKRSFLFVSILLSLFVAGCSSQDEQNDANAILSTNEFVLKDLSKKEYVIKKHNQGFVLQGSEDKILILDIFATWCPPCQAEAKHLTHLQKVYKDKLVVIGITVEDNIEDTKLINFRDKHNAKYPLANSSENRRIINEVAKKLNVGRNFGIPLMAMYKDGKLINYYQGATEEEFIESDIKRALGK